MLPPAAAACRRYVVTTAAQATKSAAAPHARPPKLLLLLQLLQAALCMLLLLPGGRQHGMPPMKQREQFRSGQMVVAFVDVYRLLPGRPLPAFRDTSVQQICPIARLLPCWSRALQTHRWGSRSRVRLRLFLSRVRLTVVLMQ